MTDAVRKAVFLDRDGVLNRPIIRDGKPYPPANLSELEILPDAAGALAELKVWGFLLVLITNQPDVARGTQQRSVVEAIHAALEQVFPLDDIYVCYHDDRDMCSCRKPLPGLLLQAASKYSIDLHSSYMIGDRWRDVEAGWNAGCRTILIDHGYHERPPSHAPDARVTSLKEAADWIIREISEKEGF
jgi:D-glycero-D-manno-heptose 1,7-bisphosphate phosphatase